jgi:hypothetical protein
LAAIVAVPVLAFHFPRWAARVVLPLLAITSAGIYLTVPDTERVKVVMAVLAIGGVVGFAAAITVPPWVIAATAFVMMGTAILDSGGRAAAIVRAAGCFGVLLALPVAGWLRKLPESGGGDERRPALVIIVVVHCLVVAWSSRALIRETAVGVVLLGAGGALVGATLLLFATARRVAATP